MFVLESLEVYRVALPLIYPFRTAFGNDETIESILVKIKSNDMEGWGEAAPWKYPAYSSEFAAGAFIVIRDFLIPLILGKNFKSGKELQDAMDSIKGNYFAKAAIDLAWWDLYAKKMGKPLWKVLGGQKDVVDVGADYGVMDTIDDLIEMISQAIKMGYKRIKLKFRPGWDIQMIRTVRKIFPDHVFHIDCNSAYKLDDIDMFKEIDKYNLAMIEQPLMHDDLIDHAFLQDKIKTPVCLDESITSPQKALQAAQIKACKYVNIKPGRVGGLTKALEIHDVCEKNNIPCWVGGMLESSIGANHCIALATKRNIKYPSDIFPTQRFYKKDIGVPEVKLCGPSQIKANGGPGIGAIPDDILLKKYAIEHITIR